MKKQILFCSLLSLFMFGGMSNVWGTENLALGAFFDVVKSNPPAELDVNAFYQDLLDKIKNTDITVDNLGKAFMLSCKAHVNAANPCDICYKFAMDIEDRYKELNTQKCSQADAEYKDGKCVCPNDGVYDKTTNTCLFKMETSASIVAANEVKVEDPSMTMKTPLQTLCEQDGVGKYTKSKCNCPKPNTLDDMGRCLKPETVAKLEQEKAAKTEQAQNAEQTAGSDEIKIVINLDGGTAVSGNCGDHTVKSGTPIKLDCVAVKGTKKLSSYVDERGNSYNKDWQFGFNGTMSQAERSSAVPHTLKTVYEEDASTTKNPSSEIKETSANSSSTVASATTSEPHDIYCNINGRRMHFDKASDAKTSTDLSCVTGVSAESKCVQSMGSGSSNTSDLCDAKTKRCVFYCKNERKVVKELMTLKQNATKEQMSKMREAYTSGNFDFNMGTGKMFSAKVDIDFTAICCSVNGESVSCRTGRKFTLNGDETTSPQPTLNDCN